MEDTNKLQSFYRSELNPLGSKMMDDINNFAKQFVDKFMQKFKNKLDKMWEMTRFQEEHLNANKRRSKLSVKTSEVTLNSNASPSFSSLETTTTSATNITSNLIDTATITGSTSTIQFYLPHKIYLQIAIIMMLIVTMMIPYGLLFM